MTMENNILPKLQRVLLLSRSGLPGVEWQRRLSEVLDALRHQEVDVSQRVCYSTLFTYQDRFRRPSYKDKNQ